jgi:hypothetical protein
MPRNSCSWVLGKTDTFRLASRKIFNIWGTNLQNPSKPICKIYVPDAGYIFVQVDQAGAEALVVAFLCRHGKFRDLFLNRIKSHVFVGLHLFREQFAAELGYALDPYIPMGPKELIADPKWKEIEAIIKASDNWPSARRYYYMAKQVCHCVDEQTEVLTRNGWVPIGTMPNEPIAIWNNFSVSFETPSAWHHQLYDGTMFHYHHSEIDQLVTPDHQVLYQTNNIIHKKKAVDLVKMAELRIPNTGYVENVRMFSDDEIKFIVATQADGYIANKSAIRFRLSKPRKIGRLEQLLSAIPGLTWTLKIDDHCHDYYIKGVEKYTDFLLNSAGEKRFSSKLLNLSLIELSIFIDELKYWDGSFTESYCHKREDYTSQYKENVEWVKTICHLIGRQATIAQSGTCWKAGINNRKFGRVRNTNSTVHYKGIVYCPTVSSGAFLIRRNGKISITGNSANYGIQAPEFAINVLKNSEGQIRLSIEEATKFLATYHTLFPEIREWHMEIQKQLGMTKTLRNLQGYPRKFHGAWGPDLFKKAYAFIPQSTVGTITNIAVTEMQYYIEDNNLPWDVLNNKHDSYLLQCPIGQESECSRMAKQFMEQELITLRGEKFTMRSETAIGFNWGELK